MFIFDVESIIFFELKSFDNCDKKGNFIISRKYYSANNKFYLTKYIHEKSESKNLVSSNWVLKTSIPFILVLELKFFFVLISKIELVINKIII